MKQRDGKAGFTLMEVLIVVIIMAAIAAFSVPNFGRALHRARARDAINNLSAIHASQLIYRSLNSFYSTCNNVAAINNINGANTLNIIENGVTYTCADASPPTVCTGVSTGNFTVTVTLNNPISLGANPSCASGNNSCP
jgi:prepilin-type N-terminal cleavage/methylation domain-containing protein